MAIAASQALVRNDLESYRHTERTIAFQKDLETFDETRIMLKARDRDKVNIAKARLKRRAEGQVYKEIEVEAADKLTAGCLSEI